MPEPEDLDLEGFPAGVQHQAARQALPIISRAARTGSKLTYQGLATALGRPVRHARAMAQVCDLLDCASTLSRRPLMALWTVRSANGEINPDAWMKDALPELRDLLIAEAKAHEFSEADEEAMRGALDGLVGMGNRKAWAYVRTIISQEEMVARLKGEEPPPPQLDSINDLGTDEPRVVLAAGRRYVRDPAVREAVIRRARGLCEFCKEPGFLKADGTRYLEAHHIIALAAQGDDRMTNVIALCPGHHREAHFGKDAASMEAEMVRIVEEKQAARS
ncbi:HNH endonuclease [Roseomonas eburnea]|uniref:HNH endonuclease n=2 Tax=Neoroseomonas eburnea TaxID=1346889 RepID=A0A9X9XK40_9PROT|nr:HNH endonuclease [Neoroseomonas eburnea]